MNLGLKIGLDQKPGTGSSPPPVEDDRVTDASEIRVTDDGETRVIDS